MTTSSLEPFAGLDRRTLVQALATKEVSEVLLQQCELASAVPILSVAHLLVLAHLCRAHAPAPNELLRAMLEDPRPQAQEVGLRVLGYAADLDDPRLQQLAVGAFRRLFAIDSSSIAIKFDAQTFVVAQYLRSGLALPANLDVPRLGRVIEAISAGDQDLAAERYLDLIRTLRDPRTDGF